MVCVSAPVSSLCILHKVASGVGHDFDIVTLLMNYGICIYMINTSILFESLLFNASLCKII